MYIKIILLLLTGLIPIKATANNFNNDKILIDCLLDYQKNRKNIKNNTTLGWLDFAKSICKLRHDGIKIDDLPDNIILPKAISPEFSHLPKSIARTKTCSKFYQQNLKQNNLGQIKWNMHNGVRGYRSICLQSLKAYEKLVDVN
ncbi:hypothetical protein [Bartonella sp. DGB1]|uniref:hypothetical protein n=1 Tax=Bartonella sp. DGB1 TaxID=3239807 RepID=UPI0035247B98